MPVLIILLYYINDLSKLKRYYDQTEFVAQQFVNIIQNVSQNPSRESKLIKLRDVRDAFCLSFLSIYPGTTMFWADSKIQLAHSPTITIYYVKNNGDGTATVNWYVDAYSDGKSVIKPTNIRTSIDTYPSSSASYNIVKSGKNKIPTSIYPTLKFTDSRPRIIVEAGIERSSSYINGAGKVVSDPKEAFKFFLLNPKSLGNGKWRHFFHSVVIFTPQGGLFDENNPPSN